MILGPLEMNSMWGPLASRYTIGAKNIIANLQVILCLREYPWTNGCNGRAMPFYEYMHIPGIDWLGRSISSPLVPKQVGSVASQLGKKFVLSETFALSGWNVSFEELKWIAEWQYVNGVNLMCQHLEGYTLRGLRKEGLSTVPVLSAILMGRVQTFQRLFRKAGGSSDFGERRK